MFFAYIDTIVTFIETNSLSIETLRTSKVQHTLIDKGIILLEVDQHKELNIDDMKEVIACNNKLANNASYTVLVTAGEFASISHKAREYSVKHSKNRIAMAMVADNPGHQLLVNFYIKVNKQETPVRAFKKQANAIKWLRKNLKKHKGK